MKELLDRLEDRFREVESLLGSPEVASNPKKLKELAREHKSLAATVEVARRYRKLLGRLEEARTVLAETDDRELSEMATSEIESLESEQGPLEEELKVMLLPKDPNDNRDIVVEIRAGTGGDEAALFAADLFRMYQRLADSRGWKHEVLSSNPTGQGGFKEVIFSVAGEEAYGTMKFESGVHRVQRVPATEASGRIHTSAASVAVLPEAEEVDVEVSDSDLKIDVYRSSGPGGQSVNTTDSAVRITHLPSGLVVTCQDEKSQLKNKQKALRVLRARLLDHAMREQQEKMAAQRKSMVSTGDRSAKIRTYNFPQGRVTDHRIGFTLHQLDRVLEGELDPLINALKDHDRESRLSAQAGVGRSLAERDMNQPHGDLGALRIDRSAATRPPKKRPIGLWIGALVVLAGLAVFLYLLPRLGGRDPDVTLYTVGYQSTGAGSSLLTASGYVVAQRQAAVASKATGRLVFLAVEEGDRVTEGQLLGRVESEDVEAELARAKAQEDVASGALGTAEARLKEARVQFDRATDLLSRKLVAQAEYDAAEASFKVAEAETVQARAGVEAARASVRATMVAVENTRIRAPFDGTVLTKEADVGEMVAPFGSSQSARGAVVTLADMKSLEVEADVSESNIQRVRLGNATQIVLDAYPGVRYPGRVKKIVPTADRAKATVLTKVEFIERDEKVLPEMSAKVTFLEAEQADAAASADLVVPAAAVLEQGSESIVFTVTDNLARRRVVQLGESKGGLRVVVSGLSVGDQVIASPPPDLRDGQKVRLP